jgi:hypothetical protein
MGAEGVWLGVGLRQGGRVSTRWTVSPQDGLWLHKVDCVSARWTVLHKVDVSPQGGLSLHKVDVSPQGGLCLHKVDVSPQGGLVYTRWTGLHKVDCAEHKD